MANQERIDKLRSQAIDELRSATGILEDPNGETIEALRHAGEAQRILDEAVTEEHR